MSDEPIRFECPNCGAKHQRGYFDGVRTFRCLGCGYVGERNAAAVDEAALERSHDAASYSIETSRLTHEDVQRMTTEVVWNPAPRTLDEYNARYSRNVRFSGKGLETTIHMPCPFCAAPDFVAYRIIEVEHALRDGATCKWCGRSLRAVVAHTATGTSWRFLQTGGDDAPPWVPISRP